jgi:very-short-patch-repair endonuclease
MIPALDASTAEAVDFFSGLPPSLFGTRAATEKERVSLIKTATDFLSPNAPLRQRLWHLTNVDQQYPVKCQVCQVGNAIWSSRYHRYGGCCRSCDKTIANNRREATHLERYGAKNAMHVPEKVSKRIETNIARYGCQNSASNDEVRKKIKTTNESRYGASSPLSNTQIRAKIQDTNIERYGVVNVGQSGEIRQKIEQTNVIRYGEKTPFHSAHIQHKAQETKKAKYGGLHPAYSNFRQHLDQINDPTWLKDQHETQRRSFAEISEHLGGIDRTVLVNRVKQQYPDFEAQRFFSSSAEREIVDVLNKAGVKDILCGDRTIIHPYELDIVIPSSKLAIEYCGLYWHSDAHPKMTRLYHFNKFKACKNAGYRLITIFEDEWNYNRQLVIKKICHIVGKSTMEKIGARNCTIVSLTNSEKNNFFNTTHIQGSGPGSVTYGLSDGSQVIAAMSFIINKSQTATLNRYATSKIVPGGFSKLLEHFKRCRRDIEQITTFADNRWSNGELYEQMGFQYVEDVPPDYYWVKGDKRFHKFAWRHNGRLKYLEHYDSNLSETDNMRNHGFRKIWNCGLKKYVLNLR